MKKQLTILLLIFGFANTTYAEPSEQETIKYLEDKVASCSKYNKEVQYTEPKLSHMFRITDGETTSMTINNKILFVSELIERYSFNKSRMKQFSNDDIMYDSHKTDYRSQAMLKDLDPNIEIFTDAAIGVSCNSGGCFQVKERLNTKYKGEWIRDDDDWKKSTALIKYYYFCSNKGAKKIAKALSHLIKLNGGKAELF